MNIKGKAAIAGLGVTQMGAIYGRDALDFASEAITMAIEDAGLKMKDIDGVLVNTGVGSQGPSGDMAYGLLPYLGFNDLRFYNRLDAGGSTACSMVQFAAMAIEAGMANAVVCVFADAPRASNKSAGAAYGSFRPVVGMASLNPAYGAFGVNMLYAHACRRHMHLFGTKQEQLGAIAIAQRQWACMNPLAEMRKPMTMEDYLASRYIIEPLRLFDCCLVSNGGVAVVVTSALRAKSLKQPPVYVLGMGQGHPGDSGRARPNAYIKYGAVIAKETAFKMAGVTVKDIDICELYDCYTYTVLETIEDYGFCEKGEGGAFVQDGKLGPGGSLPTNTGGGMLSGYYMWGMTPLSEAVIQARGQGGQRQVDKHDVILVSGNGGNMWHHSTLVLSPDPS